jgi:hypothetical protein
VKSRFVLLQQQRSGKQRQGTTASSIKAITAGTTTGSSGGAVQSRTVKNADASIEIGHYIRERAAKARFAALTLHNIATQGLCIVLLTIRSNILVRADCSLFSSIAL